MSIKFRLEQPNKEDRGILAHEEFAISLIKHPILPKETFCLHSLILNECTAHTSS